MSSVFNICGGENASYTPPKKGGGGVGTLLATESLGHIRVTSSSAVSLGKTIILDGADALSYDLLLVIITADEATPGRHLATASMMLVYGTDNREDGKAGYSAYDVNNRWNAKVNVQGNISTSQSGRGLHASSGSVSLTDETITITLSGVYHSTQTGTIDNDYTAYVYGVNLYELLQLAE